MLEIPTRMAPRDRRCRVKARVSMPEIPTIPSRASRSPSEPVARQLDGRRVVLRGRVEKVEGSDDAGRRVSLDCDGHILFATLATLRRSS